MTVLNSTPGPIRVITANGNDVVSFSREFLQVLAQLGGIVLVEAETEPAGSTAGTFWLKAPVVDAAGNYTAHPEAKIHDGTAFVDCTAALWDEHVAGAGSGDTFTGLTQDVVDALTDAVGDGSVPLATQAMVGANTFTGLSQDVVDALTDAVGDGSEPLATQAMITPPFTGLTQDVVDALIGAVGDGSVPLATQAMVTALGVDSYIPNRLISVTALPAMPPTTTYVDELDVTQTMQHTVVFLEQTVGALIRGTYYWANNGWEYQ